MVSEDNKSRHPLPREKYQNYWYFMMGDSKETLCVVANVILELQTNFGLHWTSGRGRGLKALIEPSIPTLPTKKDHFFIRNHKLKALIEPSLPTLPTKKDNFFICNHKYLMDHLTEA